MSDTAKESIDRLFNEPFEPAWMKRQREAVEYIEQEQKNKWRKLLIERANLGWKLEAERSHQRIMAKCKGVWYLG